MRPQPSEAAECPRARTASRTTMLLVGSSIVNCNTHKRRPDQRSEPGRRPAEREAQQRACPSAPKHTHTHTHTSTHTSTHTHTHSYPPQPLEAIHPRDLEPRPLADPLI
eukprot:3834164-Pleurochrysis_carterae.AAC.1